MKRYFLISIQAILIAALAVTAEAEETWTVELFTGSAYNLTTPLTIRQSGYEDIKLNARYDEKPFEGSPYYAWRVSRWVNDRAWELELVHHKIYLSNKPDEVQHFEISHGYNLLTINRAWKADGFVYHLGAGVVITHPESTIRGRTSPADEGILNEGFYLSGATAQAAAGKRFYISKKLFAAIEGKLTASYARAPVKGGDADVPNAAIHGLFGLGYDF